MTALETRFWSKVDRGADDECWLWTASPANRYGRFYIGNDSVAAHRFAYELLIGPVPADHELDHLCKRTKCVNPAHLEPVLHRENVLRGDSPAATQARQTHCIRGHEFTPENTLVAYGVRGKRGRRCRHCYNEQAAARKRAKREV